MCLIVKVDPNQGGATFTVTANASANTLQFEASGDNGTTWIALNATPSNSTTAATSTTSTGVWQANVAGYTNLRVRCSTFVAGTATVSIVTSTASARAGGGGGGSGTITIPATVSGATSGGIPCFDSATDMNTSGVIVSGHLIQGGGAGACVSDAGFSGSNVVVKSTSLTQSIQANTAGQTSLNVPGGNAGAAPALTTPCALTADSTDCLAVTESAAATNGTLTNGLANQANLSTSTATNSTATAFEVAQGSITNTVATPAMQVEATWNNASLIGEGFLYNLINTASNAASKIFDWQVGNATRLSMDTTGLVSFGGNATTTGAPPSAATFNTGWKQCYLSNTYCIGVNSQDVGFTIGTNGWLLVATGTAFGASTGTSPASTQATSLSTYGGILMTEHACTTDITNIAATGEICPDSTQKAVMVSTPDGSNTISAISRLVPSCLSVTPVTVSANVATDQNLMACTLPANILNVVGRTLKLTIAAIYSTPAASTSTINLKVKICSVSGCGSGNVLTAATITSAALGTIQVTNNAINLPVVLTTQTAGAALAIEAHGCMMLDLNASISGADTIFCDTNTGTQTGSPSAIDSTAQNFLQITGAFSSASASNSMSERMLIPEVLN